MLGLALFAAACGGDDSAESSAASGDGADQSFVSGRPPAPPEPPASAPAPAPDSVEAESFSYSADGDDAALDEEAGPNIEEPPADDTNFVDPGLNEFTSTATDPQSTFALDVDTGSHRVAEAYVRNGSLPPPESVRVEEWVNSYEYGYEPPTDAPLGLSIDGAPSPTDPQGSYVVRVGVATTALDALDRPSAAVTFVIDTSGSMSSSDRIGLVKSSLSLLVEQLRDDDTIAIVTYSGDSGIVLQPTSVSDRDTILDAIDALETGGSTNLESGLLTGYRLADQVFNEDGVNVVVLASDGVANVGNTGPGSIVEQIAQQADRGISLVSVGYGLGNTNDFLMEQLANRGDGFYAYINTFEDAEDLFGDKLTRLLVPVARQAKIQVEFNPEAVSSYRLIGYENRDIADEDFRNDSVDAGELGAGHSATALYEINVTGAEGDVLGEVFLRWEDPETGEVTEIVQPFTSADLADDFETASDALQLAVTVATFAEIVGESPYMIERGVGFDWVTTQARELSASDPNDNQRAALLSFVLDSSDAEVAT